MALSRSAIEDGFVRENGDFADLLRSLDDEAWAKPTRCEGWTVAGVAAHVTGTLADIVAGNFEGLGTPEVTQREVDERRGRTPDEVAAELDAATKAAADLLRAFDDEAWNGPAPAGIPGTVAQGIEALWYDAYVHADDIRAAVGRPTERGPGLEAAVSHLAWYLEGRDWAPATLALDGVDEYKVGGGGRKVTGDAHEFVLAATGRADPKPFGVVNVYA
jgi:uncharacterized protein (TIGR03083 family)